MKNRILTSLLAVISFTSFSHAQNLQQDLTSGRWRVGGAAGLGGSFGSYGSWTVSISPRVGYVVAPGLEVGLAGSLAYTGSEWFSSTQLGVGPFAQYYIGNRFFASGMFQQYYFNVKNKNTRQTFSADESALFIGGGYLQPVGTNTFFQVGLMYNVLYKENSTYMSSAFMPSAGIVVGL